MNKILCPVDFSENSINAIEFAVEIGKKFHSSITLLYVFTEKDFNKVVGKESVGRSVNELLEMANLKLKRIADKLNEDLKTKLTCEYVIELGELIECIETSHQKEEYDLIVMGTTGISRVKGIFFGSNAEDVIEKIDVPVLCVPENASYDSFNRIIYASDYMKQDHKAIQDVISLATMFDSHVYILHINMGAENKRHSQFVDELKSYIKYDKISFDTRDFKGNIGQAIENYMQEKNGNILVVLKKQRNFVESIFYKSFTKTLSYSTDRPFFVLKLREE